MAGAFNTPVRHDWCRENVSASPSQLQGVISANTLIGDVGWNRGNAVGTPHPRELAGGETSRPPQPQPNPASSREPTIYSASLLRDLDRHGLLPPGHTPAVVPWVLWSSLHVKKWPLCVTDTSVCGTCQGETGASGQECQSCS